MPLWSGAFGASGAMILIRSCTVIVQFAEKQRVEVGMPLILQAIVAPLRLRVKNTLSFTVPAFRIQKIHSHMSVKEGAVLSTSERQHNRHLASLRIVGEHIHRRLKIFRILKEQYRNRRRRFGLRCNLIAGLLNYELALFS